MSAQIIFIATFAASKNADYSKYGGILTATSTGNSAIAGGKLVFNDAAAARVAFNPMNNFPTSQKYSVRFKITPGYSGNPGAQQNFLVQARNGGDGNWMTNLRQETETRLRWTVQDDGVTKSDDQVWTPVSGTEYEVLLCVNFTDGAYALFIDGVQLGTTKTGTGAREGLGRFFCIGQDTQLSSAHIANFSIRDLVLYEGIVTTANYTPGYTPTIPNDDTWPTEAETKTGVTFYQSEVLKTGTYDGSDRWTVLSEADVRNLTAYKANSTSNNKTGTFVAPSLANTKIGVTGDGGVGTYDGSDRWSNLGQSVVKSGVAYLANAVSKIGTYSLTTVSTSPPGASLIGSAFNSLLKLHSKQGLIKRLGPVEMFSPVQITPSNFFRFHQGPEAVSIKGKEFVIPVLSHLGEFSQHLSFGEVPAGGTYKINFGAVTTAFLAFDANAAAVQTALRLLSGLQNITVTGNYTDGFDFVFKGFSELPTLGEIVNSTLEDSTPEEVETEFTSTYTPWAEPVKKGDRLIYNGKLLAIDEIIEMPDLGGTTMGWRIRCD